jgi:UDP-N-acetylmuramoyl-tripeptide--D-alanyl-D-alanine ligase
VAVSFDSAIGTISDLAAAVGGRLVGISPRTASLRVTRVAIDSRSCTDGTLFFALPGAETDGHRFIADAARRGAVAVCATREDEAIRAGIPCIVVDTSLTALQKLAAWYARTRLDSVTRIGITGSNGKTTTKELVARVASLAGSTFASSGNLNSETGVPLSVFATPSDVSYAVYEMAMSARGEMDALAEIVQPSLACITNIGTAHIEFLGSREAIALEKRAIASRFRGRETLVVPEDDDFRDVLVEGVVGDIAYHGPRTQRATIHPTESAVGIRIHAERFGSYEIPLPGYHNGRNVLAALSIADLLEIPEGDALAAMTSVTLPFGRSELFEDARGNLVFNDSYNANPDSMEAFVRAAGRLRTSDRTDLVLVLGDMLELGPYSEEGHRRVIAAACAVDPAALVLVGQRFGAVYSDHFAAFCTGFEVERVENVDEARRVVRRLSSTGGRVVGLKASRSIQLDRLLDVFSRVQTAQPEADSA